MYAFVNTENILRKLFLELFYAIIYMYTVLYSMCNVQPIFLAPPMVEEFFYYTTGVRRMPHYLLKLKGS